MHLGFDMGEAHGTKRQKGVEKGRRRGKGRRLEGREGGREGVWKPSILRKLGVGGQRKLKKRMLYKKEA